MRLKDRKSWHITLVTMIYTLILMYYRKFPFKLIVFASGVHLNIFIESHYMDQTAIIFLTNSDYQANAVLRTVIWKLKGQEKEFQ